MPCATDGLHCGSTSFMLAGVGLGAANVRQRRSSAALPTCTLRCILRLPFCNLPPFQRFSQWGRRPPPAVMVPLGRAWPLGLYRDRTGDAAADGSCRSMSRGRALSVAEPRQGSGLRDSAQKNKAVKMGDRAQRRAGKARPETLIRPPSDPVCCSPCMLLLTNFTHCCSSLVGANAAPSNAGKQRGIVVKTHIWR